MSNTEQTEDKIKLELDRETVRQLDFMIRFCNIIPMPAMSSNPDAKPQYTYDEIKPAIMKIRREIHRKLFPEHE